MKVRLESYCIGWLGMWEAWIGSMQTTLVDPVSSALPAAEIRAPALAPGSEPFAEFIAAKTGHLQLAFELQLFLERVMARRGQRHLRSLQSVQWKRPKALSKHQSPAFELAIGQRFPDQPCRLSITG